MQKFIIFKILFRDHPDFSIESEYTVLDIRKFNDYAEAEQWFHSQMLREKAINEMERGCTFQLQPADELLNDYLIITRKNLSISKFIK